MSSNERTADCTQTAVPLLAPSSTVAMKSCGRLSMR